MKTDQTDATILKTLLLESRTSLTDLAKKCKITPAAVRMRILRLKKAGVINGEITLVNPHALGYKYVVGLGITTAIENESEVKEFIKSRSDRPLTFGFLPKYNLFTVLVMNTMQELAAMIEALEANPKIKRVETMIWAEAAHLEHFENLCLSPSDSMEKRSPGWSSVVNVEEVKMDETDRKICRILANNARLPFKRIADQLGISTKNVIQRYNRLKGPVLTQSTVLVDLSKLGYVAFAFIFIRVANRGKMPEIYQKLLEIPNMVVALRLLGHYDINVDLFVRNFEDLFEATEKVRRIPGIEVVDIYLTPVWPDWPPNIFAPLI